jgi:hypothetical protein
LKMSNRTGGQFLADNTAYIIVLLGLALYYLSYRYPLQVNSSLTSPTYSDTPFILQVGKYLFFLAVLAAALILQQARQALALDRPALAKTLLYGFPAGQALLAAPFAGNPWLLQSGVFFLAVPLLVCSRGRGWDIGRVCRFLRWFVYLALAAELLQLALFLGLGRLPALAYQGSLSVRFGSLWDDPNGFAFAVCLLVPFVLASGHWPVAGKGLLAAALFASLLLTQSLTGIGAFFLAAVAGIAILAHQRLTRLRILAGVAVLTAVCAFATIFLYSPLAQQLVALKAGSIAEHIDGLDTLRSTSLMNYLGFSPRGRAGEAGLMNMLVNFGVLYAAVYLAIGVRTTWRLAVKIRRYGNEPGGELFYGAFFFVIAFYLGLANLPLDTIFPLNLLLAVTIIISEGDHCPARRADGAGEGEATA